MFLQVKPLNENVHLHSKGVAEIMFALSDGNPEMYILGMLHDTGKLYGREEHAENGAYMLRNMGFKYWQEVLHHGDPKSTYVSQELKWLNAADLLVNSKGQKIRCKDRLVDIECRYGFDSDIYRKAEKLSLILQDEIKKAEKIMKI